MRSTWLLLFSFTFIMSKETIGKTTRHHRFMNHNLYVSTLNLSNHQVCFWLVIGMEHRLCSTAVPTYCCYPIMISKINICYYELDKILRPRGIFILFIHNSYIIIISYILNTIWYIVFKKQLCFFICCIHYLIIKSSGLVSCNI